ncbi:hypothetical protein EVAR_58946_1 [Eumeta japonica]|uniref:Uncharacterized protein n=1 Tax=Eumeta variegata TaxID=151549 RepID=A0A4C1YHZ9_EUMVA|nr:hypothetical protein EVAR_58946_1 [Eumeta japonica]
MGFPKLIPLLKGLIQAGGTLEGIRYPPFRILRRTIDRAPAANSIAIPSNPGPRRPTVEEPRAEIYKCGSLRIK